MNLWARAVAALLLLGICSAGAQNKAIKLRNDHILTAPRAPRAAPATGPALEVSGLYLIQFESPVTAEVRERLRPMKVDLLRYIPDDAFVARLENASLEQVQALPFVRWVGPFRPEHKVHKSVRDHARGRAANLNQAIPISVLLAPGVSPAGAADVRRKFEKVESESGSRFGTVLRGPVSPGQLNRLAESGAVLWIEPGPEIRLYDEIASKLVAGDGGPGQLAVQDLGYDGSGVTVAVADSGLDSGDIDLMHPDLAGRVTGLFFYGNLTDASDEHSHGTHVAGIVGGNGATGEMDETGMLFGLGVAPGVNIVAQRLFDGAGGYQPPPTFETMTRDAVRTGAEIGSNSWGDDTQGRYDLSAMEFDALVRDADALQLGDQPYILEFSAGNAGPGIQTVGSPAVAKNVIATGASQNNRFNLPIEEFPIYDTGQDSMADFSSRGPCEDGRIKPDVVAPGTWIASLRSVYANDDFAWWPISDAYLYQGGTSQAGPHVSGAAAVFVQYWRSTHTNQTPSPALVKAALINSAVDMDDFIETDPVPNNDEGWGRIDLTQIIGSSRQYEFVDQGTQLVTGQVYEQRALVADPGDPLKITLVYTDVPGFPGAVPALVNDLDLEVVAPDGSVYRGNRFEFGESIPNAPVPDTINNVEGVHLWAPAPGEYLVRVRARNVVQDARVDTGAVDQDFALIVSGNLARPGTGIVAFDRRAYTAPSLIQLTLFDQNLAGQSTASLLLRSTTEANGETITLRAASVSGVFTGSVATAIGPALANGLLEVRHNDLIEAVYQDASPPASRRYSVRADLLPPVIANVSAVFEFGQETISWFTDEEASGILRYGAGALLDLSVTNRFFDYAHDVTLGGLTPNVTYRFEVVAEDAAGNRSTNNNGGGYFTFTPTVSPGVLIVDAYNNDLFAVPPLTGYTQPLNQLGISYDVWDTEVDGPVPPGLLTPYRVVIWRMAEFSLGTTFSSSDASAVSGYLAGGGSLLVASMEFLSRLEEAGFTTFARETFGVQSFTPDTGVPFVSGASGEPIGNGINLSLDYAAYVDDVKDLVGIPADASDIMVAFTNGAPILVDGADAVGVRTPRTGIDRAGRTVFLSFPLDAVPLGTGIGNNRAALLRNILGFLAPAEGSSVIRLDRDVYTVPSVATVEVEDLDQAGGGALTIRCFSPQQPAGVVVTLGETSRRGLFRGVIPLAPPGGGSGSGELVVSSGDTFRADYVDISSGQTASVSAMVETVPPEIIGEVEVEAGYIDAVVRWQTSELTDALVQFSESQGEFPINYTAFDGNFAYSHELLLEHLKPEWTYYFRVISRDRAGNVTIDDNGGQLYRFATLKPRSTPWTDNLEAGDNGWAVITAEGSEVAWTLGVPGNGATASSPVNAWGSNLDGREASLAESFLVSPGLLLGGGNRITLRFRQNYDFFPRSESDIFEYGEVLVITNTTTSPVPLGALAEFSGDWEDAEYDLTPYRDKVVYLVWHYVLISFETLPRFGWLIDDVSVTADTILPGTIQITNNLWQARFVLTGPSSRSGQGASLILSNATPGPYQITFGDVPFYTTPNPQSDSLTAGGTILFEGRYTIADANNNGMSDSWEQVTFGSVSPSRTSVTDTDGDGFTDLAEFQAGTDPKLTNSVLRLAPPVRQANDTLRLQWPTVPGRAYKVEASTNGSSWITLVDWTVASTALMTHIAPAGTGAPYLFRVQVRP